MRKINILIICFLLFCFIISDSDLSAFELYGQHWAPNCEKLKKDFLSDQNLYVTFTKKPNLQNKQTYWTLFWNNIEVLIPNTEYKHIHVSINKNNEYMIFLSSIDDVVISLIPHEDKVMEDVFAKRSHNGESKTTPEGVLTTKDMFGGPVKMSTIMKLAYKSTPNVLTCIEENRVKESAIAVSLILKGTATDNLMAVYNGIGAYEGWITKSRAENNLIYDLNIISDNQNLKIYYRIPEGKKYEYLPFFVGGNKIESAKDAPRWLESLNKAIELKTNGSWKEFISDARKSGISEKSLSMTCKILNIKP